MEKKIITPQDSYHYFFGYYDLQPYTTDGEKHLCHRVAFYNRLPTAQDVVELGYLDVESLRFTFLASTRAWNFQQGAFLQWFERDKSIIFNDFDGEKYIARVVDMQGKELRRYQRPIAAIDVRNGLALSLNFSRIYDFRPGYGYVNIPDKYAQENLPKADGIFLMDLSTGENTLLHSYQGLAESFKEEPFTNQKLVVNHINFSPKGTKFVFLLRNFPEKGKRWGTVLAVGDMQGNLRKLTNFEVNSHYSWKDETTLMIYSGLPEWGIYFINTETGERKRLYNKLCDAGDIHCNYAPDKKSFIGDGYPDKEKMRALYRYDFENGCAEELFKVYSMPVETDIRCDLHARWYDNGKKISYDTTENKRREICEIVL